MNVLIHGPFGLGSLADEAMLAGLLARYSSTKHGVTVLSAEPEKTKVLHGDVKAIRHVSPKTLLSNKQVWAAFEQSHLFVLTSAGPISHEGEIPSRYWLGQLELVQKAELKVSIVGVSAEPIKEMRERVRVQRLLHHFADSVSTREDESKRVMAGYGLNANRVTMSGDVALGIAPVASAAESGRVGLFVSATQPSRVEFGFAPAKGDAEGACASAIRTIAAGLLKDGKKLSVFHDAADEAIGFVRDVFNGFDPEAVTLVAPDRAMKDVLKEIARCETALSFTYHGILLSALCGVPVAGFATERAAAGLLKALGLEAFSIASLDGAAGLAALKNLGAAQKELRETMAKRVADLRKKEAQNLRAMEALVPKREVYAKEKQRGKWEKEEHVDPIGEGFRKKRTVKFAKRKRD